MTEDDSILCALGAWRSLIEGCKSDCDLCGVFLVDDVGGDQQL